MREMTQLWHDPHLGAVSPHHAVQPVQHHPNQAFGGVLVRRIAQLWHDPHLGAVSPHHAVQPFQHHPGHVIGGFLMRSMAQFLQNYHPGAVSPHRAVQPFQHHPGQAFGGFFMRPSFGIIPTLAHWHRTTLSSQSVVMGSKRASRALACGELDTSAEG